MSTFNDFVKNMAAHGLEYFGLFYSSYEAHVTDRDDPEHRGRIKIKCPKVYGEETWDKWVYPKGMMAGKKVGFHCIPQKDDVVWISFEGGNPKFPLWEYGWFLKDQAIEAAESADHYVFCTPKGHTWVVDEKNDTMYFSFKGGKVIEIKRQKINLGTKGGAAQKATLGDTNKEKLESICDQLINLCDGLAALTVTCSAPGSPSTLPINAAAFTAIKTATTALKGTMHQTLSNVVTLD